MPDITRDVFREVILDEFQRRFERDYDFKERVFNWLKSFRKFPAKLTRRLTYSRMRLGFDEVTYGFGLREIEASVSDGPHGEFTRVSRTGAEEEQGIENTKKEGRGTVAAKLHYIVAGIGMGRFKESNYNPVYDFQRIRVGNSL